MNGRWTTPASPAVVGLLVVLLTACSGGDEPSGAAPRTPAPRSSAPAAGPVAAPVVLTEVGVGQVAGRLGTRRRQEVKAAVTGVVDRYLDAAFVAGPWPREDFSAAFADFRRGVARDAAGRDLDLVTQHGSGLTAATATRRRLRIDVLAPRGHAGGATARFVVELDTAPAGPQRIAGRLYLTRQRGTWKVFGYDVRRGAAS